LKRLVWAVERGEINQPAFNEEGHGNGEKFVGGKAEEQEAVSRRKRFNYSGLRGTNVRGV